MTDPAFDTLAANASDQFLEIWGEGLIYRPSGGSPRGVTGIVDRDVPEELAEATGVMGESILISVANRATSISDDGYGGIASEEVDTGGDKIDVPTRLDAGMRTRTIVRLIDQDGGMMRLEVR